MDLKIEIKKMSSKAVLITVILCVTVGVHNKVFGQAKVKLESKSTQTKKPYELWYDSPAPNSGVKELKNKPEGFDGEWENFSLPVGNGYMGVSVFGRTDTERMQITEKTLDNTGNYGIPGLTGFAELYLDFNHQDVKNYRRYLNLNTATQGVTYTFNNVNYKRECFASYPDNVFVVKLTADTKGSLSFKIRPTIPYLKNYGRKEGDNDGRAGKVVADGDLITLSGKMMYFGTLFEGQFKVIPYGGKMVSENNTNGANGKITVQNADSVVILVAVGTNYQLKSTVFTEKTPALKFAGFPHPHEKVSERIANAVSKGYQQLYQNHLADYTRLFNRVNLQLNHSQMPNITTNQLLSNYKNGICDNYLEELFFQYGRYLLIASSRSGSLPANLQGGWSQYEYTPWTGGYWHNINVQMNYWPAFNTNLAELFQPYVDYHNAYMEEAKIGAGDYIKSKFPNHYATGLGENGWFVATGCGAYSIQTAPNSVGGPGCGGFTTQLFWDYYDYTRDTKVLTATTLSSLEGMSKFLTKVVVPSNQYYLAKYSYSPEQRVNKTAYQTVGCAFDQQMIYENHADLLKASSILKYKSPFLDVVKNQVDKLDPVQVGYSGQIKEFREENFYGEFGEKQHRHISQLVGLYPGSIINNNTPAWLDAARVTLNNRGDQSTGWAMAHRLLLWARIKDGNRSYKILQTLLSKGTLDNLWDNCPPFQIDGNFGGTAGIGEMLLQSHEGYIAPLAALPDAWSSGSFKGLVARGNFEISAQWKDGQATTMEVFPNKGGECKIYYPNISKAIITNTKGKKLAFKAENSDFISISTNKGEAVKINAIPPFSNTKSVDSLIITAMDEKGVDLSWKDVEGAVHYKVYKAVGNSPTYDLVADKLTETNYKFQAESISGMGRTTFRVTVVGKNGRESNGRLVYINNK